MDGIMKLFNFEMINEIISEVKNSIFRKNINFFLCNY